MIYEGCAEYPRAIYAIIRQRAIWPQVDMMKVRRWQSTRIIAYLYERPLNDVARDIVACAEAYNDRGA